MRINKIKDNQSRESKSLSLGKAVYKKLKNTKLVFDKISSPHPCLWSPAVFQWYHHPQPASSFPMYILSIQTPTLETAFIIELLLSALLCNCHPASALTFGGFVSKRTDGASAHMHACTVDVTPLLSELYSSSDIQDKSTGRQWMWRLREANRLGIKANIDHLMCPVK